VTKWKTEEDHTEEVIEIQDMVADPKEDIEISQKDALTVVVKVIWQEIAQNLEKTIEEDHLDQGVADATTVEKKVINQEIVQNQENKMIEEAEKEVINHASNAMNQVILQETVPILMLVEIEVKDHQDMVQEETYAITANLRGILLEIAQNLELIEVAEEVAEAVAEVGHQEAEEIDQIVAAEAEAIANQDQQKATAEVEVEATRKNTNQKEIE